MGNGRVRRRRQGEARIGQYTRTVCTAGCFINGLKLGQKRRREYTEIFQPRLQLKVLSHWSLYIDKEVTWCKLTGPSLRTPCIKKIQTTAVRVLQNRFTRNKHPHQPCLTPSTSFEPAPCANQIRRSHWPFGPTKITHPHSLQRGNSAGHRRILHHAGCEHHQQ